VHTRSTAMSDVRRRPGQAGFSLIEAMVAAAILGLALVGLVQLHKTSMRGTVQATNTGRAAEVARQLAESAASQEYAQLPACPPGAGPAGGQLPPAPAGCRATLGPSAVYAAAKPGQCTYYVDGAAVPTVDPAASTDAAVNPNLRYRVDTAVSQHPDTNNYPDTALVTIWVCWLDEGGQIRELTTSRLVTLGL
jgi:prepilin-type N-terminal cleavage/methylation domain-containing protein